MILVSHHSRFKTYLVGIHIIAHLLRGTSATRQPETVLTSTVDIAIFCQPFSGCPAQK